MTPRSVTSTLDVISMTPQMLRKGATFHFPPSPTSDNLTIPCLPRRSQTSLEDVVEAHKRRVALTLGDIDRGLSAIDLGATTPTKQSFRDDRLPVPQGILNNTVDPQHHRCDTRGAMSAIATQGSVDFSIGGSRSTRSRRHTRRESNHHASDSGLGSSIMSASSEKRKVAAAAAALGGGLTCLTDEQGSKSTVSASAITRSAAPRRSLQDVQPRLSERATNRILEFILKPLLATPSLKDFHPLVEDCPRRIHEKEIVCLRDLEKTLLLMAPERSNTAKLYLEFCVTSIRCIQATVEYLSDREQTRPQDRPYTSGYFIDLVDQIRNYAQSVQANREREKESDEANDMDAEQSSEQIRLYGGLTRNGRPAELVCVKNDGTAVSLATGRQIKMESIEEDEKRGAMMKRTLSGVLDDDDESIKRSMARPKRSATAEIVSKKCSEPGCTKEFKRSCDLTKHEKTHSRPWKCQETTCKYHEYGWPTEKELDRHINDKHSVAPKLYKCQFPPCPYQSKRESNCKQHMEKSHNYVYVRSKNNGKNRDQKQNKNPLPTPQTTAIRTPDTEAQLSSPDEMKWEVDTSPEQLGAPYDSLFHRSPLDFPTYAPDFPQYNTTTDALQQHFTLSPADSHMHSLPSNTTSPYLDDSADFSLDTLPSAAPFQFGNDFTLYEDLYSAHMQIPQQQLPTPDHNIFSRAYDANACEGFDSAYLAQGGCMDGLASAPPPAGVQQLSPVGQGNTMLFTPDSSCEGFDTLMSGQQLGTSPGSGAGNGNQFSDFQLFGQAEPGQGQGMLFGEIGGDIGSGQVGGVGRIGSTASQEYLDAFYESGAWEGHDDGGFEGKW